MKKRLRCQKWEGSSWWTFGQKFHANRAPQRWHTISFTFGFMIRGYHPFPEFNFGSAGLCSYVVTFRFGDPKVFKHHLECFRWYIFIFAMVIYLFIYFFGCCCCCCSPDFFMAFRFAFVWGGLRSLVHLQDGGHRIRKQDVGPFFQKLTKVDFFPLSSEL